MTHTDAVALLIIPVMLAIATGCLLLRRAFSLTNLLPEELAFAGAWIFLVGSLIWLGVFLTDSTLLGFGAPWTWLAASHFAFAGFGSLTVTAFCCRTVANRSALKILRCILLAHPVVYLITAAGISGFRYCDELSAIGYAVIFVTQLGAVLLGQPDRISIGPKLIVLLALAVPVGTMIPALAWAWGRPILELGEMVRYHGLVNAIGHVGIGLAGFGWGRPQPHSELKRITQSGP